MTPFRVRRVNCAVEREGVAHAAVTAGLAGLVFVVWDDGKMEFVHPSSLIVAPTAQAKAPKRAA